MAETPPAKHDVSASFSEELSDSQLYQTVKSRVDLEEVYQKGGSSKWNQSEIGEESNSEGGENQDQDTRVKEDLELEFGAGALALA